jgi:methionyl aminopeptidase
VTTTSVEGTGAAYSVAAMLEVRRRTLEAVQVIASKVEPGMAEPDARRMGREVLTELGLRRGWHQTLVRCGPNTTKSFNEHSDDTVVLAEDDIFFVDIGPIYGEAEGDAGDTFVLGSDPEHRRAKADVKQIWDDVRARWQEHRSTGVELYEYATAAAEQRGWRLNLDLGGHRLSDFPHSAHFKGSMCDVDIIPSPDLWVLEIAIVHPDRPFGAFYEDLLVSA